MVIRRAGAGEGVGVRVVVAAAAGRREGGRCPSHDAGCSCRDAERRGEGVVKHTMVKGGRGGWGAGKAGGRSDAIVGDGMEATGVAGGGQR